MRRSERCFSFFAYHPWFEATLNLKSLQKKSMAGEEPTFSSTQFLVGNVLSLTGGVDEVWMKPQMSAALNKRDQKQGSSTLSA